MARRIANPYWFRAEAARLPWGDIALDQLRHASSVRAKIDPDLAAVLKRMRESRPADVSLRWACAKELGVPTQPFVVWRRRPVDRPELVEPFTRPVKGGLAISWGSVAAYVEVECQPVDPAKAVGLFVTRSGTGLPQTIGATAATSAGGAARLAVRCSGGTQALLVNGHSPTVQVESLQQVIESDWEKVERVGLPVDDPWSGTSYDSTPQGMFDALVDPVRAAEERLERGGPPLGWHPATATGRTAPPWQRPDYVTLLKEIRTETIPRIERIYRPALPPHEQHLVVDTTQVDGPEGSSIPATAKLPPLSLLTLPASSDPFLALALGFGTAYPDEGNTDIPGPDFLVTAEYPDVPDRSGDAEVAAYIPTAPFHDSLAQPVDVTAVRGGLVAPSAPDLPWRETVRISWHLAPPAAALGRGTGAALARVASPGNTTAECLLPLRPAGDFRPLLPVPDGPPDTPGHSRTGVVDAAAEIPIGSGGRQPLYPVAWQDVFGVWSRWVDAPYVGTEPGPPKPRIIAMALGSEYAGSSLCPAKLDLELSVDWAERTPTGLRINAVYFPMTASNTPPPPGVTPTGAAPAGCFRRDTVAPFDGNGKLSGGPDVLVVHLDPAGENEVQPGTAQGAASRRYKIAVPVPSLDFGATQRWGVAVWVSTELLIGGTSELSPSPTAPALTSAASPVPVVPIPPPLPPGVPMGSVEDAQGCSHVRVHWSIPSGADLEPTRGIIVWEVAETALRQTVGLPPRAPEGTLPGVRLQQLWSAYDGMTPAARRAAFRRKVVLPGTAREADIALPKGSTDIHLFTVTTLTRAGVESPWPVPTGAAQPHESLQAVIAPRLRQPAAPVLRTTILPVGVALSLSSTSRIPVREFRVYRTRSESAARSFESMGPPFAIVSAEAPSAGTPVDPATGELTYTAEWSGEFDASWDDWFVRAVAVPVDVRAVEAERGVTSPSCEPVTIAVRPPGAPVLAPLVATPVGTGELVLVTTSTTAPMRAVALGSHRLSADLQGDAGVADIAPLALESVPDGPVTAADAPPPGVAPGAVVVKGQRSGGRSPLAVWFTRTDASTPVDVALSLVDPAGRVTVQSVTVPAGGATTTPSLDLIDTFRIAGRGVVVLVSSDAPVPNLPSYVLEIEAERPFRLWPPQLRPVRARFELNDIPDGRGPFGGTAPIMVARDPRQDPAHYSVLVRSPDAVTITLTLFAPDGTHAQVVTGAR